MTIRDIVCIPEPVLREVASVVTKFDAELHKLLDDMAVTMYAAKGIGLAAPQVGISKRVVVINVTEDEKDIIELVNPEIIESSGKIKSEEGCLSIPGFRESINRLAKVKVRAFSRDGEPFEIEGEELLSRCLQHEIDHLNGVLFIDHLSRLKKGIFKQWLKKNEPLTRDDSCPE